MGVVKPGALPMMGMCAFAGPAARCCDRICFAVPASGAEVAHALTLPGVSDVGPVNVAVSVRTAPLGGAP